MTLYRTGNNTYAMQFLGHGPMGAPANFSFNVHTAGFFQVPHVDDLAVAYRIATRPDELELWDPQIGQEDEPSTVPTDTIDVTDLGAVSFEGVTESVISDNFNDNSYDTTKWETAYTDPGCTVTETNQRLEMSMDASGSDYAASASKYQSGMIGHQAVVKLVQHNGNTYANGNSYFNFFQGTSPYTGYSLEVATNQAVFMQYDNSASASSSVTLAAPTFPVWYRISVTRSTTTLESSQDGIFWTQLDSRSTMASVLTVTAAYVELGSHKGTSGGAGTTIWDDFSRQVGPTVLISATPDVGAVTFAAEVPTINVSGPVTVEPDQGTVTFAAETPTVAITALPDQGSATFAAEVATVGLAATPTQGTATFAAEVATVAYTATPDQGVVTFAAEQPTVDAGAPVTTQSRQLLILGVGR